MVRYTLLSVLYPSFSGINEDDPRTTLIRMSPTFMNSLMMIDNMSSHVTRLITAVQRATEYLSLVAYEEDTTTFSLLPHWRRDTVHRSGGEHWCLLVMMMMHQHGSIFVTAVTPPPQAIFLSVTRSSLSPTQVKLVEE